MVGARLTKIGDLTLNMLGTTNRPEVAFKGAETKWCLFYVQDLLKSDGIVSRLRRGEVWRETSQAICKYIGIMKDHGWTMPPQAHEDDSHHRHVLKPDCLEWKPSCIPFSTRIYGHFVIIEWKPLQRQTLIILNGSLLLGVDAVSKPKSIKPHVSQVAL